MYCDVSIRTYIAYNTCTSVCFKVFDFQGRTSVGTATHLVSVVVEAENHQSGHIRHFVSSFQNRQPQKRKKAQYKVPLFVCFFVIFFLGGGGHCLPAPYSAITVPHISTCDARHSSFTLTTVNERAYHNYKRFPTTVPKQ